MACPHALADLLSHAAQVIMEEMRAAGLHRPGGFRRQAFSLGDLTALQPPVDAPSSIDGHWSPVASDQLDGGLWLCGPPAYADSTPAAGIAPKLG